MAKNITINWSNLIFVIFCFVVLVPISVNTGLLLGNFFLIKALSTQTLNIVFTSTAFAAGILLTHQTISYLYTNRLNTKPIYYIIPFLLLVVLNAASSILLAASIKLSLLTLLIVLAGLVLGGVVLRNKSLLKFRITIILASVVLFLVGITLAIYTVAWLVCVFKVMMCIVFFCRIILASNYLIRFQENVNISEKQAWLSTRLVNESIFVYIAILSNIISL